MSIIKLPWERRRKFKAALPLNLCLLLVDRYFKAGDKLIDPFAGSKAFEEAAKKLGVSVVSVDILWGVDARNLPFRDGEFDGCVTHPPYWKGVRFSDDPRDLSNARSYEEYLEGLGKCVSEIHRVVKLNSFFVCVVGDYRKKGRLYPIHADLIKVAEERGFMLYELLIWARDKMANVSAMNLPYSMTHDYILIFRRARP